MPARATWLSEALPAPKISFEFFPPRTESTIKAFWPALDRLTALRPAYVSVTCGASGNPVEGTAPLVDDLQSRAGLKAAAHLTCISEPCERIEAIAKDYWNKGIRHIVALRGDRPKEGNLDPTKHYLYAADLVRALRRIADFEISVAGYPETHPEALSTRADLDNLKRKVDAGADRIITQYCFDTEKILRFRDALAAHRIEAPLAIGVLPVQNFKKIARFSAACGAHVPNWLGKLFEGLDDDPEQRGLIGASVAAEQGRRLLAEGLDELHFYTLNRAELTIAACRLLGRTPSSLANAA